MHTGLDQIRIWKETYQEHLKRDLAENPSDAIWGHFKLQKDRHTQTIMRTIGECNSRWYEIEREKPDKELHTLYYS